METFKLPQRQRPATEEGKAVALVQDMEYLSDYIDKSMQSLQGVLDETASTIYENVNKRIAEAAPGAPRSSLAGLVPDDVLEDATEMFAESVIRAKAHSNSEKAQRQLYRTADRLARKLGHTPVRMHHMTTGQAVGAALGAALVGGAAAMGARYAIKQRRALADQPVAPAAPRIHAVK